MGADGERNEAGKGPCALVTDAGQAIGLVVDRELHFAAHRTAAAKHNISCLVIADRIEADGYGWRQGRLCLRRGLDGRRRRLVSRNLNLLRNAFRLTLLYDLFDLRDLFWPRIRLFLHLRLEDCQGIAVGAAFISRIVDRLFFKGHDFFLGSLLNVANGDRVVHNNIVLNAYRPRLAALDHTAHPLAVTEHVAGQIDREEGRDRQGLPVIIGNITR